MTSSTKLIHDSTINLSNILFLFGDYGVLWGMLFISLLIGIYFGFLSKMKQKSVVVYLLGNRALKVVPVALSMTSSNISAISLISVPAETYLNGTQYWATSISSIFVTLTLSFVYLPIFYELQSPSIFTYLEKRFDVTVRKLASGMYVLITLIYLPVIMYTPAIAFNQVTGINLETITLIICILCIFCTAFGGLRAIVWNNTLQFISIIGGLLLVIILGTTKTGGFSNLYEIAEMGDRLMWFNLDVSTTTRTSFQSVTLGLSVLWISKIALSPELFQHYLSVPTLRDSQKVIWTFGCLHMLLKLLFVFCGVLIYAKYHSCDPITAGVVKNSIQILPYFVFDITRNIPVLPGIFIAGLFSALFSSLSSSLNCVAGTIYFDFIKPFFPNTFQKSATSIIKLLVLLIGSLSMALVVYINRKFENIFELAISISEVTAGPILGIFMMGMTVPRANKHGAFWGATISFFVVTGLLIGSQLAIAKNELVYSTLPVRMDECHKMGFKNWRYSDAFTGKFSNSTEHTYNKSVDHSNVFLLFRINSMYFTFVGTLIVFVVGYPISLLTRGQANLNPKLLTPLIRSFYHKQFCLNVPKEAEEVLLNI